MKYPYIGEYNNHRLVVLFTGKNTGCTIGSTEYFDSYNELKYTDITHEYLSNTWGVVESKEHAEFIIELAEGCGLESLQDGVGNKNYFHIGEKSFALFINKPTYIGNCKQITIPLPPKKTQTATPEEEFEMEQIMKNAGDNLVLGCEDSKCDEWSPKVGGEVLTGDDNKGIMIVSKPDDHNMVVVECKSHDYGKFYRVVKLSDLSKPKTPEEELFDAFWREVGLFMNQSNLNKGIFKAAFINNITKKPQ